MNSICKINGVYASAIASGIKKDLLDLVLIYAPDAQSSAGVFTRNQFKAACVTRNQECLENSSFKAIIINSGNANAVTGEQGAHDNSEIAKAVAVQLDLHINQVATASTGIIGKFLPMENVLAGIQKLCQEPKSKRDDLAEQGILTTDTCTKNTYVEAEIFGHTIKVAGFAKGSGMIAPNMATMLGFLATNFPCEKAYLQAALRKACDHSFNLITVDSDTSTNDMVLALSVPESGIQVTAETKEVFEQLLLQACQNLAKQIVKDGEGATKTIAVTVSQAPSYEVAKKFALSVANSPLVKTAMHGADPNWGRILAALGKAEINLTPENIFVKLQDILIIQHGQPVQFKRNELHEKLKEAEVKIEILLENGDHSVTAWGCDLSKEYVEINVEYN